ncbi:MAG: hypothetical protein ABIF40_04645 [archaeon]
MAKPKKDNKKIKIVVWLILTVIASIISYNYGLLQTKISEKADIDVIMPTKMEEDYLPIWLDNMGDKTLTNIRVKISACDMDTNKTYWGDELKKGQKTKIGFDNERTINEFKKLPCYDILKVNLSKSQVWVEVYRHNETGKIIIPHQKFSVDVCMHCYWDIYFFSDQLNKTFREETYHTGQLIQEFGSEKITKENLPENWFFFDKIGFAVFDDRIMEAYS